MKNLATKKVRLPQEVLSQEIAVGVTLASVSSKLKAIQAFQQLVRSQLKPNHDYGIIPGTPKASLWKPGAEKIAKLLSCSDEYEVIEKIENWDKPLFSYKVKCQLRGMSNGNLVSEGIGECNSYESKYRYRWVYENQIPSHFLKDDLPTKNVRSRNGGSYVLYRIDNDEVFSQINTILKMAKKRALVDAALSAGRLSDIFTQDLEEAYDIEQPETFEKESKDNSNVTTSLPKNVLSTLKTLADKIGQDKMIAIIGNHGYETIEEIPDINEANKIIRDASNVNNNE